MVWPLALCDWRKKNCTNRSIQVEIIPRIKGKEPSQDPALLLQQQRYYLDCVAEFISIQLCLVTGAALTSKLRS